MSDLLIRNGRIVDGTGSKSFSGSLSINGDTITIITGDTSDIEADRIIDADNYIVSVSYTHLTLPTILLV